MKPRTQLIVLGVLLAALAVAAYMVLIRPAAAKKKAAARASTAGTAQAAKPGTEAPAPLEEPLPSPAAANRLADWLAPDKDAPKPSDSCPPAGVLGIKPLSANEGPAQAVIPTAEAFAKPPRLQGILIREGVPVALIEGESYQIGQRIAKTDFVLVAISETGVTVRAPDGREVAIDMLQ